MVKEVIVEKWEKYLVWRQEKKVKGQMQVWEKAYEQDEAKWLRGAWVA